MFKVNKKTKEKDKETVEYNFLNQTSTILPPLSHSRTHTTHTSKYSTPPPMMMMSPTHNNNNHINSTSTLGRFSKSTNRLQSPQGPPDMYRSVQTLPRKLEPQHNGVRRNVSVIHTSHPSSTSTTTNTSRIFQNTGPAKPARTYKSLNRSKSFNVHGN